MECDFQGKLQLLASCVLEIPMDDPTGRLDKQVPLSFLLISMSTFRGFFATAKPK